MSKTLIQKYPAERITELKVCKPNKIAVSCNGRTLAYFPIPDLLKMIWENGVGSVKGEFVVAYSIGGKKRGTKHT
jgi:hypothetical protein